MSLGRRAKTIAFGETRGPPANLESAMDSAIIASYEGTGRRGCTEIDRWLWDGKERDASQSRRLIERNAEEFQRYGEFPVTVAGNPGSQGGRPSMAYLLNFQQALCYCQLSEAPRAADVREALNRAFTKLKDGELVPVTSDAPARHF
jgi:hypothetical protein